MRERIRHIKDPEIDLRRRLLQLLSCIALTEFIIVSIYTAVSGGDIRHCILMIAGTVSFGLCICLTFRLDRIREGSAVSALIYFLLYPVTFFDSGGMYGGAPVVFVFALVYIYLITRGTERIVLMAISIGATFFCYARSVMMPEVLSRHTMLAEHVESFLAIMLATLLLCMLFGFVTSVYSHENRIVSGQKKEIERLNQAQKVFFSSMSHEIRTPVNAIIALNEINMKEEVSEEVMENSENIEVACRMLLHTINEILDMSRLESGGLEIRVAPYAPAEIIHELDGLIRMSADKEGLEFLTETDPGLPPVLIGDEVRIRQVMLNLLTNAVKYTRAGSVKLAVYGRREADDSYRLMFDVADTGTGIKEEDIPYLFTAFRRADEENTHHIEGTGLGLTIVKQLLDLMGGTVTVESEYGKGSNFHVEIPQQIGAVNPTHEAANPKLEAASPESDGGGDRSRSRSRGNATSVSEAVDLSGVRVLAVDDTKMNLMVLSKLLRASGVALDLAESGRTALEKTLETHYDVILMDHQMPEMDGIECLGRIREQENGKSRDSRIVCLTANAGPEMKAVYIEAGFDGYLEKPVRGRELEEELARQSQSKSLYMTKQSAPAVD